MGSYIWVPLRSFEVLQDQVRSYKGQLCWYILDLSIIVWCLVARDRIYGSFWPCYYKPKMYGDFHDNPLLWTMNTTYVSKVCKGFVILHISPSLVIDPAPHTLSQTSAVLSPESGPGLASTGVWWMDPRLRSVYYADSSDPIILINVSAVY